MTTRYALNNLFVLRVDELKVGVWTELSGLSASYQMTTIDEGGNNRFQPALTGRLTYENVVLRRPLDDQHSGTLETWFREVLSDPTPATASIEAFNEELQLVAAWEFVNVLPIKYVGPSFSATSIAIAMETFEFTHDGFKRVTEKDAVTPTTYSGSIY